MIQAAGMCLVAVSALWLLGAFSALADDVRDFRQCQRARKGKPMRMKRDGYFK